MLLKMVKPQPLEQSGPRIEQNGLGIFDMKSITSARDESQIVMPATFQFQEAHDVRIQVIDGEPWFCLKDVCEVLTIANSRRVASEVLDADGVRKAYITDSLGREQEAAFVNEPNLYRVIFRSNKPEARQFQDWVFNEVLPTIRKTGSYQAPQVCAEPLSNVDMGNLKYLINLMSSRFTHREAWSFGIWHALRLATGTPSPKPFTVEDLPALSNECRRIMEVTNDASAMICQFEKDVLKFVIRKRADLKPITEKMERDFQSLQIPLEGLSKLEKFEEIGLMRLERRIR